MTCSECGQEHVRGGRPTCTGHVIWDRDAYVPGQPRRTRQRLPEPRACMKHPAPGQVKCRMHGAGSAKVKAKGARRVAEQQVLAAARKLVPDADQLTPIDNPLTRLLELAAEADAFRESLRRLANDLDGRIRYPGQAGGEQLRAEVATYRAALRDVTDLLIAIARLDIEQTLARVTVAQAEQSMAAMQAGCDAAGLDDDVKATVMAGVGRHLRCVAG